MLKAILVLTIIALGWGAPQTVRGEPSSSSSPVLIVVADGQSVRQSPQGIEMTRSFVGLVSGILSDHRLAFISTDDPSEVFGPVMRTDPEFNLVRSDLDSALASSAPSTSPAGTFDALAEAFTLLGIEKAPPGSSIYLVIGGASQDGLSLLSDRVSPLVSRFGENGWPINGVSLPGTSPEVLAFVEGIATASGGRMFELSVPEGFKEITDAVLGGSAGNPLVGLVQKVLEPQDLLTSSVAIAPGTRESTIIFFKESPFGTLRLSNPSGFEVTTGDRVISYVEETPHVVVWKLADPEPGRWRVDVRGVRGSVSGWHFWSNKYSLILDSSTPIPADDATTLIGYASDEHGPVTLTNVRLFATITTPGEATLVHEMNDKGLDGDAVAGDGLFSVVIPPLGQEGNYRVDLEMSWPEFDHRISSQWNLKVRSFPVIDVTPEQIEDLRVGERTKVASLSVHVAGEPYPVSTDELTAEMESAGGAGGLLELEPQRLFGEGTSWLYDVYFTPDDEGLHTLTLRLDLVYAERQYTHVADSLFLSSVLPPEPIAPEATPEKPVIEIPVAPAPDSEALSLPLVKPAGFPWWVLVFPGLLLVGAVVIGLNWLVRTRPYGYLYTDRDELVVDFSKLRRNPVLGLILRNYVSGRELKIPGLEGVWFRFVRKQIALRAWWGTPSVRVNNQPLTGEATIQHRAWIGTHGKLYSFLLSPPSLGAAQSGADD